MRARLLLVPACAVLLSSCAGMNRHCVGEFEYQQAVTLPPPAETEGLAVPQSPGALRIPPAPGNPVPYAREFPDPKKPGKTRTECLDVPPRLPPEPAAEPEPPKPQG